MRPKGLFGGEPGAAGSFLVNDEPVRTQKRIDLRSGDVVRLALPGGGGYARAGEPDVSATHEAYEAARP
jgi:N-methylhydantoinase B